MRTAKLDTSGASNLHRLLFGLVQSFAVGLIVVRNRREGLFFLPVQDATDKSLPTVKDASSCSFL